MIEKQVDECNHIKKVGKYYVNPADKAVTVATAPAPASALATQSAEDVVNDSAKKKSVIFSENWATT